MKERITVTLEYEIEYETPANKKRAIQNLRANLTALRHYGIRDLISIGRFNYKQICVVSIEPKAE